MKITTICSTATIFVLLSRASCLNITTFPAGFQFGAATSHVQTEGAWNVSDKSVGSWDHWAHRIPSPVKDGSNADVACDSYHKYKEDVQMAKNIGFDVYRLSISWSRLLPNGYANVISADGLRFYKNFLRELVDNGIKPVVNLHHLDHPQTIEDMGGWMNPLIVDWFADYARVVFRELGPMVDTFITINEPELFCKLGYEGNRSAFAPGKELGDYAEYICLHNALMAHAKAWHVYNDEFRAAQKGRIGMVQACISYQPENASNPDDVLAVRRALDFNCGWIGNPLFVGDYPEIMKTRISTISEMQGYARSRLPEFTNDEIAYVRGTSDFVGLNYYQAPTIRFQTEEEARAEPTDSGIFRRKMHVLKKMELADQKRVAHGLRDLLRWVRDEYNNTPVMIMENGYRDEGGIDDYDRISYFHDILSSLLSAIRDDGCNVVGYSVWSLMDTFEGSRGYTEKFGLYHVDFDSPNRTRTPKLSAEWWKMVVESRQVQPVPQRP